MLKQLVFIITESYYPAMKSLLNSIQDMLTHEKRDVTASLFCADPDFFALQKLLPAPAHSLLVTDSPLLFTTLQQKAYYCAALYHEKNSSADFHNASYALEDIRDITFDSYQKIYERLANLPWSILETDRMFLRETTVEDVRQFYKLYASADITRYMENLFQDIQEEIAYTKDYIQHVYHFYGFGLWTILLKNSNTIIGRAGLNVREGYETPELGFVIDVHYQRQGYAYEICRAILNYAKEELDFSSIHAFVHPANTASISLLEKLGFQYQDSVLLQNTEHLFYLYTSLQ